MLKRINGMGFSVLLALGIAAQQPVSVPPPLSLVGRWEVARKAPKWSDYKGKIVMLLSSPVLCCGFDVALNASKKVAEKYPTQLAVLCVVNVQKSGENEKMWKDVNEQVKPNFPVGFDPNSAFTKQMFPGDSPQYTFTFFGKDGKRLARSPVSFDKLEAEVAAILGG